METRSSHILVGGVVLVLIVALFAFILWLARFDGGARRNEYDIFFRSVSGLATGSAVNFAGVPVGQVTSINLDPNRPQDIRVRIEVQPTVPVLAGTRASIEGVGFTGVSIVDLEGAMAGQAPLTQPGPFGVPVIPTKPGALAGLLESAPELLNNASTLLTNLNSVLNVQNQERIGELLGNLNRTTNAIAERSPEIAATLADARLAIAQAGDAAQKFGALADSGQTLLGEEGAGIAADLRATTRQANTTLADLSATAAAARPAIDGLSTRTIPEANALIADLRAISGSLGAIAGKLDEDPAGALVGGRTLPDYVPAEAPQ